MRCALCRADPCQVLGGHFHDNAAWLFSDEAERITTSGQWCFLFEHLVAHIVEPEPPHGMIFPLTIELVPQPCWYSNMRKAVTRSSWGALRRQVYAQYHHRCGICQAKGQLQCHEIWRYDDEQHLQTLQGFIALCEWCHHVKHLGLSGILAEEGKLDYGRVVQHFLTVNRCSLEDFERHRQQAFAQWRVRNAYEWRTDLGLYAYLVSDAEQQGL